MTFRTSRIGAATSFVGAGAAVGAARVVSLVCTAVQLPLLTTLLTPAEYSLVALAIAASTYFSLVAADPVTLAFQRFPGSRDDRGPYRYALVRVGLAVAALGVVTILFAFVFGAGPAAIAVVGWGIGLATTRLISMAWLMWGEPWKYSANLMLSTGVRTVAVVALVSAGLDGALAVGIAGLASAIAALLISPRVRRAPRQTEAPWPWRFGMHLALASLAGTVLTSAGLLMLPLFVDRTAVGRFAAMSQLATLSCGAVLGLVLTVAYPVLRRRWDEGEHEASRVRIDRLTVWCLLVALICVTTFSVADSWIPRRVVGGAYVDAGILPLLVLAAAFTSMGQLASWHHQLRLRAPAVSRRTWLSAVVGIGITAIGALRFGTTGAAIGVAAGFLVYVLVLRHGTGISPLSAALAVVAFAAAVGVAVVPAAAASGTVTATVAAGGALALLAYIAWRLRTDRAAGRGGADGDAPTASSPTPD